MTKKEIFDYLQEHMQIRLTSDRGNDPGDVEIRVDLLLKNPDTDELELIDRDSTEFRR